MSDLLPHDHDTEAALVGWCLASPTEAWRVLDVVTPGEFHRPAWAGCIDVLRSGHRTAAELADLVEVPPADLVAAIAAAPMRHDVDRLVERVAAMAARRRVIFAADEATTLARDPGADVALAVESLRAATAEIDDPSMRRVMEVDEFLGVSDDPYDWVIPDLLERGDRLLVTAVEGSGKSFLLRQIAVATAAGVHPFRLTAMPPKRALLVDVENLERKVRRELTPLVRLAERRPDWDPGRLGIAVRMGGLDLARAADVRWLGGLIAGHRPDLLVIGPLYQLHGAAPRGDAGGENHARELARTLDRLRERFGCALVMETHAPHGSMGSRDLRPFGSSVWLRWPEFGFGLRRDREKPGMTFEWAAWRGPRDRRDWPSHLSHGTTGWPWIARYEDRAPVTPSIRPSNPEVT